MRRLDDEVDFARLRAAPPLLRVLLPPDDFARARLLEFADAPFDDLLLVLREAFALRAVFVLREAFLVVAILIPSSSGMAPPY